MKRSQAESLLERVRNLLANDASAAVIIKVLKDEYQIDPLVRCTGEAHKNDNCGVCAPRWGWTGDRIKIT